jgi:hypothetical protein
MFVVADPFLVLIINLGVLAIFNFNHLEVFRACWGTLFLCISFPTRS